MKLTNIFAYALHLAPAVFIDYLFKILLKKKQKKIRKKKYPLLAVVPTDSIGQWIVRNGIYEETLLLSLLNVVFRNFLPEFKEQTVIDCGANIGNHALFFSRYFKHVIAFEPNPSALKLLDTNIFLNKTKNIQVIPIGLSNKSAVLPFYENPNNLGGSGFNLQALNTKHHQTLSVQQLRVERGDTLLEQHAKNPPIALIKLDIEGEELNALQGLEKNIQEHHPIILFEAKTSQGEKGSKAIFNFLSQHNYDYFYTLEPKKPHPFVVVKFFEQFKGYPIVLNQISEPEDRYYSSIIATTKPLQSITPIY